MKGDESGGWDFKEYLPPCPECRGQGFHTTFCSRRRPEVFGKEWYEDEPEFLSDADPEASVIPTHEVALAYLRGIKATMWPSRGYTISGNEGVTGIEQAAEFVTKLVEDIASIRNVAMGSTRSLDEIVVEIRNRREGY